ncbi:MAG: hypothetical protein SGPRY_007545 [Prymnesium sp.]
MRQRMGAASTDSVQQHLLELPASDESGMQYISPPAARKLAAAAVTGQIRVAEFVKESRQLLGASAPANDSLDELREAWRLMRAALLAAMLPLGVLSATDAGVEKLDARMGATATSTQHTSRCPISYGVAASGDRLVGISHENQTKIDGWRQLAMNGGCNASCGTTASVWTLGANSGPPTSWSYFSAFLHL